MRNFLPDDERARFVEWLNVHRSEIPTNPQIDPVWIDRYRQDISAGRWDGLCIPRRLYGEYLADCALAAIADASSYDLAEVALVTATVTSLQPTNQGYVVDISADGASRRIAARAVILAIGSPPVRRLLVENGLAGESLTHDIYDPNLESNVARLKSHLGSLPRPDRNVLIVGGNAAALEFVLALRDQIRDLHGKITLLAPSGRPRHWRKERTVEIAKLSALTALQSRGAAGEPVTADELYRAVVFDLSSATATGNDIAAVPAIMNMIPSLLGTLDDQEQATLAARYGMAITSLLREDCGDAVDIVDALLEAGALEFAAGRFGLAQRREPGFEVTVVDGDGRECKLSGHYAAIVGAVGFERISTAPVPLLQQLLRDGVVRASSSDSGLAVDGHFRAAPRLFVVGPLLAGNANSSMVIWHAESVRRIIWIADIAADYIIRTLDNSLTSSLLKV